VARCWLAKLNESTTFYCSTGPLLWSAAICAVLSAVGESIQISIELLQFINCFALVLGGPFFASLRLQFCDQVTDLIG